MRSMLKTGKLASLISFRAFRRVSLFCGRPRAFVSDSIKLWTPILRREIPKLLSRDSLSAAIVAGEVSNEIGVPGANPPKWVSMEEKRDSSSWHDRNEGVPPPNAAWEKWGASSISLMTSIWRSRL